MGTDEQNPAEALPQHQDHSADSQKNSMPINKPKSIGGNAAGREPPGPTENNDRKTWFSKSMEALIVVFTAVNVCVAYFQWDAMRRSNYTAERALLSGERPWVGSAGINPDPNIAPGQDWKVNFYFVNTGKTPAIRVNLLKDGQMMTESQLKDIDYRWNSGDGGLSRGHLFPGQNIYTSVHHTWTAQDIADWQAGKKVFVAWGEIFYEDWTGKTHYTAFCSETLSTGAFSDCPVIPEPN